MIDVHRNVRLPGDTQRLFQLFHDIETLAARVNSVVAPVTPRHLGHVDDFIGILGASCMPRRGEAERALFHRLRDEAIHLLPLGSACRSLIESDNYALDLLGRDARGDVDGDAAVHDFFEIAGEGTPIGLDSVSPPMLESVFFQQGTF